MLPGPSFAVPLVGGVVQMVLDPYKFWEDQGKASFPGAPRALAPAVCVEATGKSMRSGASLHMLTQILTCAGLSYNSILGKLMVFSTDVDVSRRMLSVNDESSLLMAVHPSAKSILGPNNLAFMHGPAHKAIRKSFLALFTRKALGTYVELQDGVVRTHIADWLTADEGREIEIRHVIR